MRLEPDGLLGAVIASESLGMTDTMINGAGGCRSRAQIMLHDLIPAYAPENTGCCRSKYFSRQSRLPCTYMNNEDVVFGASAKISEGVESVSEVTGRRVVLLDTLGASLICTDGARIGTRTGRPLTVEGDLSSMSMCEGYDRTVAAILSETDIEGGCTDAPSVNLLGYGIQDPGWEQGSEDLRRLLSAMGVETVCVPGCMPERSRIGDIGKASLNVMARPEYCMRTAEMLETRFGTPKLRLSKGAPVGYSAIRSFVREIASALGTDPSPALEMIDSEASAVHKVLMNYDRAPAGLRAKGFSIEGESSTALPLASWMAESFGMVPRSIRLTDSEYLPEITGLLRSIDAEDALENAEDGADVVFCDGIRALEGRLSRTTVSYVETRLPRGRHLDLMGRCVVGLKGCRYILDEMLNGVVRFRCGQPTEVDMRPGFKSRRRVGPRVPII